MDKGALLLLLGLVAGVTANSAESSNALSTIQGFYKSYLSAPEAHKPEPPISKAFRTESEDSREVCRKYADGPCGWGDDGDQYFGAPEIDPYLSWENSGITIAEVAPGLVQVNSNVYPASEREELADERAKTIAEAKPAPSTTTKLGDPREVVEQYCAFDAAGEGTSSEGWLAHIRPLTIWPDGPGWDTFTVIAGYSVGSVDVGKDRASVKVTYHLIGDLSDSENGPHLVEHRKVETVTFHLTRSPSTARWKITAPQNPPHVSIDKAKEIVRDSWGEEHQDARQELIRKLDAEARR